MATKRYINIKFPFQDSPDGLFLNLNTTDSQAIKSDLMHLLLTRRGQRLYNPNFGTNLIQYIFEPEDSPSFQQIQDEITTSVKRYLPNLQINSINVVQSEESEYAAEVRLDYTVSDGVFTEDDFVVIKL
jgi:hypothetical protein